MPHSCGGQLTYSFIAVAARRADSTSSRLLRVHKHSHGGEGEAEKARFCSGEAEDWKDGSVIRTQSLPLITTVFFRRPSHLGAIEEKQPFACSARGSHVRRCETDAAPSERPCANRI